MTIEPTAWDGRGASGAAITRYRVSSDQVSRRVLEACRSFPRDGLRARLSRIDDTPVVVFTCATEADKNYARRLVHNVDSRARRLRGTKST